MATFKVGDHFERTRDSFHPFANDRFSDLQILKRGYKGIVKSCSPDGYIILDEESQIHHVDNIKKIDSPINSPVKTISKKEIVPGDYNNFQILNVFDHSVGLKIKGDYACFSSKRLREAAQMFIEMAEVLEENSKDKD